MTVTVTLEAQSAEQLEVHSVNRQQQKVLVISTGNRQQAPGNRLLTDSRQQIEDNRQQATGNRQQATGNRQQKTSIQYFQQLVASNLHLLLLLLLFCRNVSCSCSVVD